MAPLPWPRLWLFAAVGTAIAFVLVVPSNLGTAQGITALVTPAAEGPSAALFATDFPDVPLAGGVGADGQMFYAAAREPMHLGDVVDSLDRPRYRAQRILMPLLAWVLHPTGGGPGLIVALVVVNLGGILLGGLATGALSRTLGGPSAAGLAFGILPGTLMSLHLGVPDALALALALSAVVLDLRGRRRSAIATGIAAVLAKESLVLVLVGYACWRRDRAGIRLVAAPVAVAATWWCWLRFTLPGTPNQSFEFAPVVGVARSLQLWLSGTYSGSAVYMAIAVLVAVMALRKGALRAPLGAAVVVQLAFMAMLSDNVLKNSYNGTRAALPLVAIGGVALLVARRSRATAPAPAVSRPLAVPASVR